MDSNRVTKEVLEIIDEIVKNHDWDDTAIILDIDEIEKLIEERKSHENRDKV